MNKNKEKLIFFIIKSTFQKSLLMAVFTDYPRDYVRQLKEFTRCWTMNIKRCDVIVVNTLKKTLLLNEWLTNTKKSTSKFSPNSE